MRLFTDGRVEKSEPTRENKVLLIFTGIRTRHSLSVEVSSLIDFLLSTIPLCPLTRSLELELAALDHARDLEKSGTIGSCGSDGGGPLSRIKKHGIVSGTVGESIKYGRDSPQEIVVAWLVSDGDPRSSHRHHLLNPGKAQLG